MLSAKQKNSLMYVGVVILALLLILFVFRHQLGGLLSPPGGGGNVAYTPQVMPQGGGSGAPAVFGQQPTGQTTVPSNMAPQTLPRQTPPSLSVPAQVEVNVVPKTAETVALGTNEVEELINKAVDKSASRLIEELDSREIVSTTCETSSGEEGKDNPEQMAEIKRLTAQVKFLKKQAGDYREKNNYLRKLERDHRKKLKKVTQELKTAKKVKDECSIQKAEAQPIPEVKQAEKGERKWASLPHGWLISGVAPGMLMLDHTKSQRGELIEEGDVFAGLEFKKIDADSRLVETQKGFIRIP